jgi:hypothetical protein
MNTFLGFCGGFFCWVVDRPAVQPGRSLDLGGREGICSMLRWSRAATQLYALHERSWVVLWKNRPMASGNNVKCFEQALSLYIYCIIIIIDSFGFYSPWACGECNMTSRHESIYTSWWKLMAKIWHLQSHKMIIRQCGFNDYFCGHKKF